MAMRDKKVVNPIEIGCPIQPDHWAAKIDRNPASEENEALNYVSINSGSVEDEKPKKMDRFNFNNIFSAGVPPF